jgi:hypothetical protein
MPNHCIVCLLTKSAKAINLFIASADQLYGSITTLRREGCVFKQIPWAAFALSDSDWARVLDAQMILAVSFCFSFITPSHDSHNCQDSNRILHHFSADKHPGLYRALPALEDLQSAWEAKLNNPCFEIYHEAIRDGLTKLMKYYCKFDEKPAYILALSKFCTITIQFNTNLDAFITVLHPYFKLHYIKLAWGGAEEQEAERAAGNKHAKNWQEETLKVVETAVSFLFIYFCYLTPKDNMISDE